MKSALTSFFFATSLSVFALAGCTADTSDPAAQGDDASEGEVEQSEDAITGAPSNFGYFVVTHRDYRRCVAPLCGGFFVKRVNQAKTLCANGLSQAECYVSSIQLSGIGLSAREEQDFRVAVESGKAIFKARTYKSKFNGLWIGTVKANEGWLGATGSVPDGSFYRAASNGIVCITAPCPSTTAYGLNGLEDHNVIETVLDQTTAPASAEILDRAGNALGTKDGILVAGGIQLPKCVPGSMCGPRVVASEFYVRVTRREGQACGARNSSFCNADQFCKWTLGAICGAADAPGHCSYRPSFCTRIYKPVCSCDGTTYSNECAAFAAGASVSTAGACPP